MCLKSYSKLLDITEFTWVSSFHYEKKSHKSSHKMCNAMTEERERAGKGGGRGGMEAVDEDERESCTMFSQSCSVVIVWKQQVVTAVSPGGGDQASSSVYPVQPE